MLVYVLCCHARALLNVPFECSCKQISKRALNFWDIVTNSYVIDLSKFELPGGCSTVTFSCIDPVYVWITCCNALRKRDIPLHWDPKTLRHPVTGNELHGAGIQYSNLLRSACSNANGKVALFNINWDSGITGFGARTCVPIHAQVMNTNSSSTLAVGLVGYLPYIPVPEGYRSHKNYVAARHHVLQVGTYTTLCLTNRLRQIRAVYALHVCRLRRLRRMCIIIYVTYAHRIRTPFNRLRHSFTPSTHYIFFVYVVCACIIYVTYAHRIRTPFQPSTSLIHTVYALHVCRLRRMCIIIYVTYAHRLRTLFQPSTSLIHTVYVRWCCRRVLATCSIASNLELCMVFAVKLVVKHHYFFLESGRCRWILPRG